MAEGFRVEGATGLARGLDKAAKDMDRAIAKAHRGFAAEYRGKARTAAQSGTAQQRRMAGGIGSKADKTRASLTVKNTKGAPGAQGAFWGAKKYPQFQPWVGQGWDVAVRGEGPYVINQLLAEDRDRIEQGFLDASFDVVNKDVPAKPKP